MHVERCHIEASCVGFSGLRHLLYTRVRICTGRGAFYSNSMCIHTVTNSVCGPSTQLVVPSVGVTTARAGRAPLFDSSNLA